MAGFCRDENEMAIQILDRVGSKATRFINHLWFYCEISLRMQEILSSLISERQSSGGDVRSPLAQSPENAGQGIGINHHQINAQIIGEALHELILKSSGAGVIAVERGRTRAGDDC